MAEFGGSDVITPAQRTSGARGRLVDRLAAKGSPSGRWISAPA
jgi:hypothetical protein